ncbi:MAG: NADH-quinone oxidoreductase subunit L [Phycisphaerae bacterium]
MNHTYEICLALGVLIPLLSFVVLAFGGPSFGKPRASYVALAAIGISCLLAFYVLIGWLGESSTEKAALTEGAFRYHWAELGDIPITVGVKLDGLTVIMFFMVTFIAFWIHFFSIGYMEGHSDEVDGTSKYHRFFAYLSLFCFSMLGLVISSSLLFMFFFWELVGLCSYLLIGYYFDKKFASDAAMKAFITNRVGDFGFIIGLALVVMFTGTFDLDGAAASFAEQYHSNTGIFASSFTLFGYGLASLMGIGLFCGAMGKSAQFPLHVWLPDAMAGPTPVSALIHAATMVAAGVYLVARVFRLLTPDAQMFIAVIGCITLTITALIAIVQTDIKKVLAYSTLSQLGYMIFGMGVGAWVAALFHLMTHAFFKSMLFLCSGQVIEGCHHEQDIRNMGGLRKKMPVTCWTFFVGVLAISGFGIPAMHVGLGGYFSKDEILAVAYERAFNAHDLATHEAPLASNEEPRTSVRAAVEMPETLSRVNTSTDPHAAGVIQLVSMRDPKAAGTESHGSTDSAHEDAHDAGGESHHAQGRPDKMALLANLPALPKWLFWLPIFIAYITPFYMMRCWWLTFFGKPRDEHVYKHAHENWKMYVPLMVLAVGTIFCSYRLFRPLIAGASAAATDCSAIVAFDGEAQTISEAAGGAALMLTHGEGMANPHHALAWIVGLAWLIGMGTAGLIYRNGLKVADRLKRGFGPIHTFLEQKMYFDHVYDHLFVMGMRLVGVVAYAFDKVIIDGLVNLSAFFTRSFGVFVGRQLDMPVKKTDIGVVDALANGIAGFFFDAGTQIRRPQNGRIRTYVLLTAGSAAVVLVMVLYFDRITDGFEAITRSLFIAEGEG